MIPGGAGGLIASFARALEDLPPGPVGLAVSGGGDSMAMLSLCLTLAETRPMVLKIATVDHGLRPESGQEAAMVARIAARHGLSHTTLHWREGPPPTGNLMEAARRARRRLLAAWAQAEGVGSLLLAHTLDDQAEGFLMNLARGAGIDGLCGMRPRWQERGILWLRPLLEARRADLRDWLAGKAMPWVEDPTNSDDRYARSRARKAMAALAPTGVDLAAIGATIANLAATRRALVDQTAALAEAHVKPCGAALCLDPSLLDGTRTPPELLRRLILAIIGWMSGAEHPPRAPQVARLLDSLRAARPAQLSGLRFLFRPGPSGTSALWIAREGRAIAPALPPGAHGLWDARWQLAPPRPPGACWAALGAEGLRQSPDWRRAGLPRIALEGAPALWQEGHLLAAPLLRPQNSADPPPEMWQSLTEYIRTH